MVVDHLKQVSNDRTPMDTQTLVPSSFPDALRSNALSGQDTPVSQSLRFPTGPRNQCVVMNVLTVSVRYALTGRKETVEVESKDDLNKPIFQHKSIPFGRSFGATFWSSFGRAGSSSLSKQKDHAELIEETAVQSYPALDQVCSYICCLL